MVELEINGETYDFPETREMDWGGEVTKWATAVTEGMLQKAGGSFTLINDADFGPNYGLVAKYFKARTGSSDEGIVRLGNTDAIGWRNSSDTGNLKLEIIGDELVFNGIEISSQDKYPAQLGYGGF